ncbi:MAG TPA: hypothetical protein VMC85_10350 [Desulfomonilaceae bacterium]|nr:hypothetical protein [Desulfomonilaceae bacterium]
MKREVMKLIGKNLTYAQCQRLITQGFSMSKEMSLKEVDHHEFTAWMKECRNLLSLCQPEPYFPRNLDPSRIEELVMLLSDTRHKIFKGEIECQGLLQ